ncbi:MAG: moaA nirJ pqqE 1 [Herbinix sp.]|nr:moaA nirJ pqqE 1 [Herbinix sp.]
MVTLGIETFDKVFDYSFSDNLIMQTRDLNKLLTLELELSRVCNYRCKYCYSEAGESIASELSFKELCDIIDQAKVLGTRTVILIGGGEPLLYKDFKKIVNYIYEKRMNIIVFTNGSLVTRDMADFLFQHDVLPIIKINGFQPKIINWLCGNNDAYHNFLNALKYLEEAGYNNTNKKIGVSTIICKQNYNDILLLWDWARENNIIPYFERVIYQGRAENQDLSISQLELKDIYNKINELDKMKYQIEWNLDYCPVIGMTCNRHYYSIYINADASVQPCSGIDLIVGNIRNNSLQDIIINSAVIQELRHIDSNIKGKCKSCKQINHCYGCRGNAYQLNRDYLASDPMCWKIDL